MKTPKINVNNGGKRKIGSKNLKDILKTDDDDFVDFVRRCFIWNPKHRMTPDEALQHLRQRSPVAWHYPLGHVATCSHESTKPSRLPRLTASYASLPRRTDWPGLACSVAPIGHRGLPGIWHRGPHRGLCARSTAGCKDASLSTVTCAQLHATTRRHEP